MDLWSCLCSTGQGRVETVFGRPEGNDGKRHSAVFHLPMLRVARPLRNPWSSNHGFAPLDGPVCSLVNSTIRFFGRRHYPIFGCRIAGLSVGGRTTEKAAAGAENPDDGLLRGHGTQPAANLPRDAE